MGEGSGRRCDRREQLLTLITLVHSHFKLLEELSARSFQIISRNKNKETHHSLVSRVPGHILSSFEIKFRRDLAYANQGLSFSKKMASEVKRSPGYAHTKAIDSGILPVGTIHKLHYEQYGKNDGKPGKTVHL